MDTVSYILLKKYIEDLLANAGDLAGKSAYQYAVEGGYTGTEEEFAAKMAEEIPSIDSTLTNRGQAADAKAVGDRFRELGTALEEVDRLNGILPAVTAEDAGKPLVVSPEGKIIVDSGTAEVDVLPEQALTFVAAGDGITPSNPYQFDATGNPFNLAVGKTYYVVLDGARYTGTARQLDLGDGMAAIGIGNLAILGMGDDTGEPFVLGDVLRNDTVAQSIIAITESELTQAQVTHTMRVYQMVKDVSNQADWNVNDETDPAYIKNRPFYAGDPVLTELLPETTLQFTDGTASITDAPDLMLEKLSQNDQTYIVIWDGTEYEVTASPFNGIPCLGNLSIEVPEHENTGEPFLFLHFDQWNVVTNDAGAEHTISVNHAERAIRKLPSEFLADDVGNKLPVFDLKEMGMTDVTSMNEVKTLAVDTTQLRIAMGNGQIKIAFGVDGAVIKTVLSCGIISGNVIYASAMILNPQKIGGLALSPVIVALIATEGGLYFILKEIDASIAQINEIDALIGGDA